MATPPNKIVDRIETAALSASASSEGDQVARETDNAAADLETLRADVIRLSKAVSALVGAQAANAKDSVTETASELYDTGLDYVRNAESQVRGVAEDVAVTVQRNPLAAVGIVFGIGYIIGLLRRR